MTMSIGGTLYIVKALIQNLFINRIQKHTLKRRCVMKLTLFYQHFLNVKYIGGISIGLDMSQ